MNIRTAQVRPAPEATGAGRPSGPTSPPAPDLLTVAEVATMLGVSEGTVRWWRHNGEGPVSFKIGRHLRFDRAEVYRWLDEQRAATGTVLAEGDR